ncbi:putative dehydrogenase [Actinobacteria bacterium IMCC26207]|nr:putative dehydrogenase [Actinobacteria bacterium IMCC26207]
MALGNQQPFRRKRKPSIALAGAGYIAVVHALAADSAGAKVTAVASAGGKSARHLAGELDAKKVSPEALPSGADFLIVATPPAQHAELAVQGLRAGASVLVEKPLATTLAEADRIVSAAATAAAVAAAAVAAGQSAKPGGVLRCAENLLHSPVWAQAVTLRAGLGPLTHLSLRTLQPPPDWGHFAEPLSAGGVLFDLGPHALALALGLADEPVLAVSASLSSTRQDGADDSASVVLRFESGLRASIEISWVSEITVWEAQASSDSGVLRIELIPEVLLEHNGEQVAIPLRHPHADPTLEQFGYVDQLLDLISQDPNRPGQTAEQARSILEIICAAYQSAGQEGNEVQLPFDGDRSLTPMQIWKG